MAVPAETGDFGKQTIGKGVAGKALMAKLKTNRAEPAVAGASLRRERSRRRGARGVVPWLVLGLAILAVAASLVLLGLSGRSIPVPEFVVARIEARTNAALKGQASLSVGSADVVVGQGFVPQVRLRNVTLISPAGKQLAQVTDLRSSLDPGALLRGRLQPAHLTVRGAKLALRRMADGSLDIAPAAKGFSGQSMRPVDMIEAVEQAFAAPALAGIGVIEVSGLQVLVDDSPSGQIWTISDGALALHQDTGDITIGVGFGLSGQTALPAKSDRAAADMATPPARATFLLSVDKGTRAAKLIVQLSKVSASDLAALVPALAFLAAVDAPISGGFKSQVTAEGDLGPFEANLNLGAGALRPTKDTRPIDFDSAHLGLSFDPATSALSLNDLRVDSPSLQAEAVGQAWLKGKKDSMPDTLVGQIQLRHLKADPEGLFASPVSISQGALDLKLELSPFRLTIGQLVLVDRGRKISADGVVGVEPAGWSVALNVAIDAIETERLLALWPVSAVPGTRKWIHDNVATGELFDVKGALRLRPGQAPRLSLGYQFRGAEVRFLKTLPPVVDGEGYAAIEDNTYTLVVEKGRILAPKGGDLNVAGSVLKVPDIRVIPASAEISMKSQSSITAALAILDEPPFSFISKAGQPVDLATGRADVVAKLRLKLVKGLKTEDVDYDIAGTLAEVRSEKIVKGRVLSADQLTIAATPAGMQIKGKAALDGVPVDGTWRQAFGPDVRGKSRVEAVMELSPATLRAFAIGLPDGAVAGTGRAMVTVDLMRGKAPEFSLESDLSRLKLSIPEVSWTKAAGVTGSLKIAGQFGTPAKIDRLDLAAAGLTAKGQLTLKPDGTLDKVVFPGLKLADWFSGDVTLTGRGKGRTVGLAIAKGSVDLRLATFGASAARASDAPPMDIALDRLRITDDITLDGFRGTFAASGGLNGDFAGLVNGTAPVTGTVVPGANGRSAFRIESGDAGLVFAAAGLYASGRGGQLKLILQPEGDKGSYDGTLNVRNIRVVDAPALAGLLDAISVVGLITQLQGAGIVFSDVAGRFLLTPDAVEIREGSAVGASLGVSAAGVYRSGSKTFDLQGVISPVYLLNGIGQIFSRQRDGLFGFSYTLTGTRDAIRVSVNPLSILTPGMFRDLFRKDPPRITP